MSKIDWQVIDTAPRDGTPILLFTSDHGIVEAWYAEGKLVETENGTEYDGPLWVCADDAFQIEIEEFPDNEVHDGTATHWAPLPGPPIQSQMTEPQP